MTNGSLDTSFNGDGYAIALILTLSRDEARRSPFSRTAKLSLPDLREFQTRTRNIISVIVRYNSNGSLDASFGATEKLPRFRSNAVVDQVNDRYPLILQPNGKSSSGATRLQPIIGKCRQKDRSPDLTPTVRSTRAFGISEQD